MRARWLIAGGIMVLSYILKPHLLRSTCEWESRFGRCRFEFLLDVAGKW